MQPRERLTAKEMEVAALVWEGQTNREIARAIGTTEQVVKNYLRNTSTNWASGAVWSWPSMLPATAASAGGKSLPCGRLIFCLGRLRREWIG
jgi:predicted transcriptional regulator